MAKFDLVTNLSCSFRHCPSCCGRLIGFVVADAAQASRRGVELARTIQGRHAPCDYLYQLVQCKHSTQQNRTAAHLLQLAPRSRSITYPTRAENCSKCSQCEGKDPTPEGGNQELSGRRESGRQHARRWR